MKYVNNAWSSKMLQDSLAIGQIEISEEEFMREVHQPDVISVIGHPDTAKLFDLPENRQTLVLNEGDILFVCELNNKTNTRLPEGITRMEQIPEGFSFRFLKITVFSIPDEIKNNLCF